MRWNYALGGVLLLALVLRMAAAFVWQDRMPADKQFVFPDSYSYWALGRSIAQGEPYQYGTPDARVFRTPGYPLLLAGLFSLGAESVLAARLLGAVLGTAAVAATYALARVLFNARAGVLAALITAVYPGAIALSVFVLSEALFVPLMMLNLLLWALAWRLPNRNGARMAAAGAGIAAAAATLARPSWLMLVPLAIVVGLLIAPARAKHLELSLCVLALLILCMTPWWVRNARVTGRFVPTTLQVGASLYDGLNPQATGASDMRFVPDFQRQQRDQPLAEGESLEYALDRRMRNAALDWARQNPWRVMELVAIKFARMWNVWPNEADFRAWPLRLLIAASYLPLMALALWGVWRLGCGWPALLCWLPAAYLTLLHVVFVSSLRYREPAMLPLAALAAAVVEQWWRKRE